MVRSPYLLSFLLSLLIFSAGSDTVAQQFGPEMYSQLHWRMIGPFRGGRTRAASGVVGQPNVFYFGAVNGGVWKSNDYGRTWNPIFDEQPTGSIGAIAVAPSDPNVIYVGSGEGLHRPDLSTGDGIYKSTDAGKSWTHLGLREGQQIPWIAVDPHDANRLFVAVLGHPYGPNEVRGIYRSTDGGKSFQRVLYKDENTGGSYVEIDSANPEIVFAGMWEAREGPWENSEWSGAGGGLFKSSDGGSTWRQITKGLPAVAQVNAAIAASQPSRMYASVAHDNIQTIYRSDDAGESWSEATKDPRPATRVGGGGELPVLRVDPKNPDVVYSASIVTWKSADGGKSWTGIRGAPGGDDYQNLWINPDHPEIILLVSDQGAIVTVNGGETWSSWYNQPTAQIYHVGTDNAFPYRVCGGQQESGSVCISSRGNDGEITMRDWHPVAAEEYGYVTPDPLDPDIIYGGKLTRYDRRTGQAQDIMPEPIPGKDFRVVRTEPVVFSPQDPHVLYFASNRLWKTSDRGYHWQQISPDLTREKWETPISVGKYRPEKSAVSTQRGVIYAVAPSTLKDGVIWAGTDDGLIHLTTDGGAHWTDISPPQLVPWAKVSIIEASHFDVQVAYAAINTLRLDVLRPQVLRTRDAGKTWVEIRNGIPDGETVNAVREDPERRGLLFAGTERQVYVSFDDGDHWQSLRQNMPATSVRDVVIKGDDLIAGTHGRGFWIMDNITPLRQLSTVSSTGESFLLLPQNALRVRWDTNPDTPLPPDEPAGENPPDGAMFDYFLKDAQSGPVVLDILDRNNQVVRHFSSSDPVPQIDPLLEIPAYWVRPPQVLSAGYGMHRFVWDLHYPPVPGAKPDYPISAIPYNTAPSPTSPWVMPGRYTVRLSADGKGYTQPLIVKMDPRVNTTELDLEQQFAVSKQLYDDLIQAYAALDEVSALRKQLHELQDRKGERLPAMIAEFEEKLDELAGGETRRRRRAASEDKETLNHLRGSLRALLDLVQSADVAPTNQAVAAAEKTHQATGPLLAQWKELQEHYVPALNLQLRKAKLPEVAPH